MHHHGSSAVAAENLYIKEKFADDSRRANTPQVVQGNRGRKRRHTDEGRKKYRKTYLRKDVNELFKMSNMRRNASIEILVDRFEESYKTYIGHI